MLQGKRCEIEEDSGGMVKERAGIWIVWRQHGGVSANLVTLHVIDSSISFGLRLGGTRRQDRHGSTNVYT
ncbi:hypothetical protein AN958_02600 [Leucoagaricus sp. SymC.cos]|nr:hypothetical protein AN958_02600 [Leucoagaricus sp. SymC.cos]